jgi:hypothetical protein
VKADAEYPCTKYEGHLLHRTDAAGHEGLEGTHLWVCAQCEPRVEGRWLAEVEIERLRKERAERASKDRLTSKQESLIKKN